METESQKLSGRLGGIVVETNRERIACLQVAAIIAAVAQLERLANLLQRAYDESEKTD